MSTLKVNTLQNASGVEVYTAKAWVRFNGTGTVAIDASGNVSSITDNGTGDYTVNFTNAMSDANYSVNANGKVDIGLRTINLQPSAAHFAASSIRVLAVLNNDAGLYDTNTCSVSVFR